MHTPLNDILEQKVSHLSFHTPAHNGGIVIDTRKDVTELSFSDNLLSASGVIFDSQQEVAKVYGVENVLYSTAGATALIHTVIRALATKGNFLIYGEAHKSIYNAMRINGVKAFLYRGRDLKGEMVKRNAKVVVCTSPSYFGKTLDLKETREICDSLGADLVVDSAHGAHFGFSKYLPVSATKYADLVIHSQHKTMATLTGGATLCYANRYKKEVLRAFGEVHTTSPSYLVMSSIESAVKLLSEGGEKLYESVVLEIEEFKEKCVNKPFSVLESDDPTRLVIEVGGDGESVCKGLERLNIYPEMVYGNKIVFIVTPFNYQNLDALYDALDSLDYDNESRPISLPECEESVELIFGSEIEEVLLEEAEGRISYREIGLYPPGVPVVVAGERLTAKNINFLKERFNFTFGLEKNYVLVLK